MDNQPCTSKQAFAEDAKLLAKSNRRSSLRSARFSKIDNNLPTFSKKNSILTEVYVKDDQINDLLKFIDIGDGLLETPKIQKLSCADTETDCSWDMLIHDNNSPAISRQKKLTKTKKSTTNQRNLDESDDSDELLSTKLKRMAKEKKSLLTIESESDDERVNKNVRRRKTIITSDTDSDNDVCEPKSKIISHKTDNNKKPVPVENNSSDSEDVVCEPKPKVLSRKTDYKKPILVDVNSGSDEDCYNNMNADISNFFLNSMSSFEERERLKAEEEENPTLIMQEEDSSDDENVALNKTKLSNKTTNSGTGARNTTRNGINFIAGPVHHPTYSRRGLRPILDDSELAWETLEAKRHEGTREKLLSQKTEMMEKIFRENNHLNDKMNLHLDFDTTRQELISVDPQLVKCLKDYQREGVQFMYDVCFGGIDTMDQFLGSGCILAHCMGLGKTLQLITLIHTIIQNEKINTKKILVLCPKSTVMNWVDEIEKWTSGIRNKLSIEPYVFPDNSNINDKLTVLKRWYNSGLPGSKRAGVLMIGYEAFRTLIDRKDRPNVKGSVNASIRKTIYDCLLCPGPDLVVCDEGHIIKNSKSKTNKAVSQINTPRRIVLTGTPIQNNLKEYYCMVNFIKPCFLGTQDEFNNLYANPIKEGQHNDSLPLAIKIMKQRSYILNKTLSSFVQRKEQGVLKDELPKKFEYVISVPLTPVQVTLYSYYLNNNSLKEDIGGKTLMLDYAALRKLWTHPRILELARKKALFKKMMEKARTVKIMGLASDEEEDDDGEEEDCDEDKNKVKCVNSVISDWWKDLAGETDIESIKSSNKFKLVFDILKECEAKDEKCLIFSSYVTVLDCVEDIMKQIHTKTDLDCPVGLEYFEGPWVFGQDYYRIDGQTPRDDRHKMIKRFNDPHNHRTKCFLISSKAGGQGINLTGANRAIILDTSWNPATDQQCIFRIYRLGQLRTCYIYRLLAMGTMEDKIYSRSVTKQALSGRVVDTQQIDRHYSMAELHELYELTYTDYKKRPVPIKPEDDILTKLLDCSPRLAFKYHQHETLLEDKPEEALTDAEKNEAWEVYRRDSIISAASGFNDGKANKANKRQQRNKRNRNFFNFGEHSPAASSMDDSDNENYHGNYNGNYNENYDTNNVVVPPRTMHIQNNINDMINNIEREMLLKKSAEENGGIVVDDDSAIIITGNHNQPERNSVIMEPSGMVYGKRPMPTEEPEDNKRFKMM